MEAKDWLPPVLTGLFALTGIVVSYLLSRRKAEGEEYRRRYAGALRDLLAFYRLEGLLLAELMRADPARGRRKLMTVKKEFRAKLRRIHNLRISRYASPAAIEENLGEVG